MFCRQADALGGHVEPHDPATRGLEQLHGELPEQTQPEHHDRFPNLRIGVSDALQRDGPDRGIGGRLGRDARRHGRRQQPRHAVHFGMIGQSGPRARHELAESELPHIRRGLDHFARQAVAQRHVAVELFADGLESGQEAVAPAVLPGPS